MKVLFFSVFILLGLSSCKKETFTPCDGFEELYGEWESIDSDVVATVTFDDKGSFIYASGVDRTYKERIVQCTNKDGSSWEYVLLEFTDGILAIFHNEAVDTIVFNASAYNHSNNNEIEYKRYFVKSK